MLRDSWELRSRTWAPSAIEGENRDPSHDAQKIHELTLVDLDGVSGGRKDGGGPTVGKVFLTFRFDTVFTSK